MNSYRPLAVLCACLVLFTLGCSRRPPTAVPDAGAAPEVGLYRATLRPEGEKQRRFRLLLYAELPDRLHGEALTPTSATALIVDAGEGRVAIDLVRDRVAFVGDAEPGALERLLGIRVELHELVEALLGAGSSPGGHRMEREPAGVPGLPERFRVEGPEGSLELELKRRRPFRGDPALLGRGVPTEGFEERPLDEFGSARLPDEAVETEAGR